MGSAVKSEDSMSRKLCLLFVLAPLLWAGAAGAQAPPAAAPTPPPTMPYGAPINLDDAKKAAAAAVEEVKKIGAPPNAIAIVDHGGFLIYFERMDNTQLGSVEVAIDKARSAALFRRPSKVFEDALAGGGIGLRILALHGAMPIEGGLPLVAGGKIVGAIGASGGTAQQDGQVAKAGADTIK
jgi:glc operon protein GlcG